MDPKFIQKLIRKAMREQLPPGKYDVFLWEEGGDQRSIAVAWKSYTRRAVELEAAPGENGEELMINGDVLPNGVVKGAARYIGSFRIDPPKRGG